MIGQSKVFTYMSRFQSTFSRWYHNCRTWGKCRTGDVLASATKHPNITSGEESSGQDGDLHSHVSAHKKMPLKENQFPTDPSKVGNLISGNDSNIKLGTWNKRLSTREKMARELHIHETKSEIKTLLTDSFRRIVKKRCKG